MKNSNFVIYKLSKLLEQGLISSKDLANELKIKSIHFHISNILLCSVFSMSKLRIVDLSSSVKPFLNL